MFRNQPLGRGNKVIEDRLFVLANALPMPLFPVLAPATNIGNRKQSASLQPGQSRWVEIGQDGNAEATITVKQSGIGAVSL